MILDQFLNESSLGYAEDVEATNEGFDFEFGGFERVIELSENDMHKLNMAMMASEVQSVLALNENNQAAFEQIQEASIKGFFEKVKGIIKKLWARMKEVFNTVVLYFDKFISDSKFVDKANTLLSRFSDSAFNGLEFQGYNYTLDKVDPREMYNKMSGYIDSEVNKANDATTLKSDEIKDTIISAGLKGANRTNFSSFITKELRGGKDSKENISFNKSTCTKAITGFKSAKAQLNNDKKIIDDLHNLSLKSISTMEKDLTSGNDTEEDKKSISEICKAASNLYVFIQNKANTAISLKLTALKEEKNQQKNIIMKAISVANKNTRKQNNSVIADDDYISNLMNQF